MDAVRWRTLSPLLDELLELDDGLRSVRLDQWRAQDPELADELCRLLAMAAAEEPFPVVPLPGTPCSGIAVGTCVGPYRLERQLGEGCAGQVWLARHPQCPDAPHVALKLLGVQAADPSLRARFEREIAALSRLDHPGIARLHDAGCDARGQWFLALDYVAGTSIFDHCRQRRLPLPERLALFEQLCDAVAHAHARGVVHRDLKPANVLVDEHGRVRLLDFGIARLLDPAGAEDEPCRAFTLHYAAPEQVRGEPEGVAADVYALGVVLYELLTDCKPYRLRRQSDGDWERAIQHVDVLPPSQRVLGAAAAEPLSAERKRWARQLRGDLDAITLKALQKDPALRYADVPSLAQDLSGHQRRGPLAARKPGLGLCLKTWWRRLGR